MEPRYLFIAQLAFVLLSSTTLCIPSSAQNAPSLEEQLTIAESNSDHLAAVEIATRLSNEAPDDIARLTKLARLQQTAGDNQRAAESLRRLAKLANKETADLLEIRGDIANSENRPKDALSDYQLAHRAAPESIRILEKLASHHTNSEQPENATIYFDALTKLRNLSSDHYQLARAAVRQRDWNQMIHHLTSAAEFSAEKRPSEITNYESLLGKALQLAKYDQEITADPKNVSLILERAALFYSCRFPAEALEDARRALRIDGQAPHIRYALAFYYAANGDREKGAQWNINTRALKQSNFIEQLAKADRDVRKNPGDVFSLQTRAKLLISNQQIPLAIEDIDRILELDPNSVTTQLLKADTLRRTSRDSEARQLIRQLAKQFPDNDAVELQIGQIRMSDGLYHEAIKIFDNILARHPKNESARDSRSLCYKRLQKQPPVEAAETNAAKG